MGLLPALIEFDAWFFLLLQDVGSLSSQDPVKMMVVRVGSHFDGQRQMTLAN
jgi:hypothetical protein